MNRRVICISHVMVIGAGLSGCTTAAQLADRGVAVTLVEKQPVVGGRVRSYGCKATDKCNNCGVCLTGNLWEKVEKHQQIEIIPSSTVIDVSGSTGDYSVTVKTPEGLRYINNLTCIVVSTGFESMNTGISSHLQIAGTQGIITGTEIEAIVKGRTENSLFEKAPESVAFIQCFGSRDKHENGSLYCSRVCCAYSTRAARVIRQYYPECKISFFYMELQSVANTDYFQQLKDLDVEFIKCRPLEITGGAPVVVAYDDPDEGLKSKEFDLCVLSEGIHPGKDSVWMAETYGLQQDEHGFLGVVGDSAETGIYVSGCAKTPLKIEETYADSVAVANGILVSHSRLGGLDR